MFLWTRTPNLWLSGVLLRPGSRNGWWMQIQVAIGVSSCARSASGRGLPLSHRRQISDSLDARLKTIHLLRCFLLWGCSFEARKSTTHSGRMPTWSSAFSTWRWFCHSFWADWHQHTEAQYRGHAHYWWWSKSSFYSLWISNMNCIVKADYSLLFIRRQELNKKELQKNPRKAWLQREKHSGCQGQADTWGAWLAAEQPPSKYWG